MPRKRAFDPVKYKLRNRIERTIGKLKQLRRIATRHDRIKAAERAERPRDKADKPLITPPKWPLSLPSPQSDQSPRKNHGCCGCPAQATAAHLPRYDKTILSFESFLKLAYG
jgi:hypothetical protein